MNHASPNRLEENDEPEEDIINAAGLDEADAHALARRFGLDDTMTA